MVNEEKQLFFQKCEEIFKDKEAKLEELQQLRLLEINTLNNLKKREIKEI